MSLCAWFPPQVHRSTTNCCYIITATRHHHITTLSRSQRYTRYFPPVDTLPPVPSFPGLFVLFAGGLLFPGLPVALGAIRGSSSSTLKLTFRMFPPRLLGVAACTPVQGRNDLALPRVELGQIR